VLRQASLDKPPVSSDLTLPGRDPEHPAGDETQPARLLAYSVAGLPI